MQTQGAWDRTDLLIGRPPTIPTELQLRKGNQVSHFPSTYTHVHDFDQESMNVIMRNTVK